MDTILLRIQTILRPELDEHPFPQRLLMMSDVVGLFYSLPLVIIGLIWLTTTTSWVSLRSHWLWLTGLLLIIFIFSRLRFFVMQPLPSGRLVGSDGDFLGVVLWASVLIFGHEIIWLFLVWIFIELVFAWIRTNNRDIRWNGVRSTSLNAASLLIPTLFSLAIYQRLGGVFPMAGLGTDSIFPAMVAIFVFALVYFLIWLPFILYVIWVQGSKFGLENPSRLLWFSLGTIELPFISLPFGVLASGIFVEHGGIVVGIYGIGMLLIALLAYQLSRSAEKSRRQAVQLMGLERLGRDILKGPTDARNLPALLRKHIPDMFPCRRAVVWLAPETYLLKFPDGKDLYTTDLWDWILTQEEPHGYLPNAELPWQNLPDQHYALLITPIISPLTGEPIGGLFIELHTLPQKWDKQTLEEQYPVLKNLAAQISAALNQADTFQETLKHQRVAQELRLAGEIQLSFLPDKPPDIPGWDIAASFNPARQTSGDFYDFFMLDDDRLGIIIADVADKGLGAALYMALGRTLLLTYAHAYPENPAAVLQATNQRMLSDARAQMFITAFYGVLALESGRLIYCNAGHHPPFLIRDDIRQLNPNGMALGIDENAAWVAVSQRIEVDETLLLYTDGVVESQNATGMQYGMEKLVDTALNLANRPSQWVVRGIWENVLAFSNGTAQSDDVTLVCIRRRN